MKSLDRNGDGKVNFEDFYVWWHHGITNKLEPLVKIRMKGIQARNKLLKKIEKIGGLFENKFETETSSHYIGLNIGEAPPLSYLDFKILNGSLH